MTGLGWASAFQAAAAIRRRDVSAAEVLEDQLDRIQRHDARLRSVVTAAVAASLTPFDIAGDTSGSLQCPAAFCGVFGMRPTEHRVPMTGMLFIHPVRRFRVLTTAGPMARASMIRPARRGAARRCWRDG
jgi:Asp-tRNA(Asn)/Glu-tRNA(Gln) amidotransferase A subunit family amidase